MAADLRVSHAYFFTEVNVNNFSGAMCPTVHDFSTYVVNPCGI